MLVNHLNKRKPVPRQTEITHRHRLIAMLALALGGFGIGVTEFVSMGLLSLIAEDFNVAESTAGHVITAYAMGVVVGAPVITAFTGMIPRRRLLILLMIAFYNRQRVDSIYHFLSCADGCTLFSWLAAWCVFLSSGPCRGVDGP